jgi:hypothetical protein
MLMERKVSTTHAGDDVCVRVMAMASIGRDDPSDAAPAVAVNVCGPNPGVPE